VTANRLTEDGTDNQSTIKYLLVNGTNDHTTTKSMVAHGTEHAWMNPHQSKQTLENSMHRIVETWSMNKYIISVDSVYVPCGPEWADEKPDNILFRNISCTSYTNAVFRSYDVKFKMGRQVDYWDMYSWTRQRMRSRSLPGGIFRTIYGEWGVVYEANEGTLFVELSRESYRDRVPLNKSNGVSNTMLAPAWESRSLYETKIDEDDYEIGALFHDMKLIQNGVNICGIEIPIRYESFI